MKKLIKAGMAVLAAVAGLLSCTREEYGKIETADAVMLSKQFVYEYTMDGYLWNTLVAGRNVDYRTEPDAFALFDKLRYDELDRWSYVSDRANDEMDGFAGIYTSYGYSVVLGKFSNTEEYFGVVQFVYAGGPAEKAGLKRGDILLTIGGAPITEHNYMDLYYAPALRLGTGVVDAEGYISPSGVEHELTAVKMYEDPVVAAGILDKPGHKVGYLAYMGFYAESHPRLVEVFRNFKEAGVTDLVLDMRYNPGGNAQTPPFLASLIAPESNVRRGDVFLQEVWNRNYMDYFKAHGEDLNIRFQKDIPVNLDLNRVYVLVSDQTASASEAVLSGLMPYMDVVKIGTATHGKYCGAALLSPLDSHGKPISAISNWLLSLVVYKFVNADGFTEFVNGIEPDHEVVEQLSSMYPLGDERDPLLAKALELITGVKVQAAATKAEPAAEYSWKTISPLHKGGCRRVMTALPL